MDIFKDLTLPKSARKTHQKQPLHSEFQRNLWRKSSYGLSLGQFSLILRPQNEPILEFDMKKDRLISLTRVLAVAFLLFSAAAAHAQEEATFSGTIDSLWSNPNNWAEGIKPNENVTHVTINADVLVDENVTIQNLLNAAPCTLIVQSGKKLTVSASIVWNNGDFILEDEAQLVYDDPLQVTVKKKITAYDENNHFWDVIASPIVADIMPSIENGFLTDPETGYALYAFDEASRSFLNFKETPFPIVSGKGYLYSNALDTTLLFTGLTHGSGTSLAVGLDYHAANGNVAGCNLVGNPLPCNAYPDRSYYLIDDVSYRLAPVAFSSATEVKPCTGIFVKADEANETVAFSRDNGLQSAHNRGYIEISVAKSNAQSNILDQAILSFNPDDNLRKMVFDLDFPRVYFSEGNNEMAILSIDSVDALPLKFKVAENGSYTLRFEPKGLDLNFLRLIDNLNGNTIDLLATPNYTFNATANDYSSRFRLIFDPHYGVEEQDPSTGSGAFAYYADGEIVIFADLCDASLQVCDMTGRIVLTETINSRNGTSTVPTRLISGVYVLRLVTGGSTRVQKIIIR